ncbi:MAG: cation diffusion facilitator family transporter [Acidimicrobiia bacterium]
MEGGSRKAIIAAFLANLGIAIAKFIAFLITASAGMLAESVHSLADTGNQGLLLLGGKKAARKATPTHPFGYGRERYFWAFVVALVLFSLGGAFALYEGIEKLRHPHELDSAVVGFIVLGLAILLESFSFYTAIKEANHVRHGVGWAKFIRRSKSPELPVVLLEDFGALIGLVIALFGLTMAEVTGNPRWDAAGSIAIGTLLTIIAIVLAVEMKGLLIGESASDETLEAINAAIVAAPLVNRLIHLRTEHIGPDELLVGMKVEFDHSLDLHQLGAAIDGLEAGVRGKVPSARIIYVEPDIHRG